MPAEKLFYVFEYIINLQHMLCRRPQAQGANAAPWETPAHTERKKTKNIDWFADESKCFSFSAKPAANHDNCISCKRHPGAYQGTARAAHGPDCGFLKLSPPRKMGEKGDRFRRAKKKGSGCYPETLVNTGSPDMTRTCDPLVNSQLLYRLSYRGMSRFEKSETGY